MSAPFRIAAFGLGLVCMFALPPNPSPDWHSGLAFLSGILMCLALNPRTVNSRDTPE